MTRSYGITLGIVLICALAACTKSRTEMNVAGALTLECGSSGAECRNQAVVACPGGYDVAATVRHKRHQTMAVRCK